MDSVVAQHVRFMLGEEVLWEGPCPMPRLGELVEENGRTYRVMVIHRRIRRVGLKLARRVVVDLREVAAQ